MNDCERLSDRMPDVALGRAEWTPEEAAHLAGCAECRAEWEVVLAARGLDAEAPELSDTSAIASSVLRRLAQHDSQRARSRRVWSIAAGAVAAAAVLVAVVTTREPSAPVTPQVVAGADALVPLPELEELESAQLDSLLQSLDRPYGGSSALDATTLGDDDTGELEQVFSSWEG